MDTWDLGGFASDPEADHQWRSADGIIPNTQADSWTNPETVQQFAADSACNYSKQHYSEAEDECLSTSGECPPPSPSPDPCCPATAGQQPETVQISLEDGPSDLQPDPVMSDKLSALIPENPTSALNTSNEKVTPHQVNELTRSQMQMLTTMGMSPVESPRTLWGLPSDDDGNLPSPSYINPMQMAQCNGVLIKRDFLLQCAPIEAYFGPKGVTKEPRLRNCKLTIEQLKNIANLVQLEQSDPQEILTYIAAIILLGNLKASTQNLIFVS